MSLHNISTKEKVIVMLAVMSGLFLVALDQTIIATALGAIVNEFNSFSSLGFVVTAYMLTSTVSVPLAGKLSDMYGRRPILVGGVAIFTIASLFSGMSGSIEQLIAFRAIQGIGGGMIMANAFTIVGDLFTPLERGKWQGLVGATFGMSSVVGPLLGGWLTDQHNLLGLTTNWRWTFFINIPIGIVAAYIIFRHCPTSTGEVKHRPDYRGAFALVVALSAIILAVDNTEAVFSGLISGGISLGMIKLVLWSIALLSAIAFIVTEKRAAEPILPLGFFKNKIYTHISLIVFLYGAAFLGSILYLTQFNQQVFGASASTAGLMLLPMVGGMMVASIATGQIVSRVGTYKNFLVAGLLVGSVSILALTTFNPDTAYWHEALIMIFLGAGLGMVMPILNLAVQNEFPQKYLGAATASVQLFRGLGSTIGVALLSGLLTAGILSSIGDPRQIAYVQTIQRSPAGAQMLKGEISADTLLAINLQKDTVYSNAQKNIDAASLEGLKVQQDAFSRQLVFAFSDSLHRVFLISSVLMALALGIALPIKQKKLRNDMHVAPLE